MESSPTLGTVGTCSFRSFSLSVSANSAADSPGLTPREPVGLLVLVGRPGGPSQKVNISPVSHPDDDPMFGPGQGPNGMVTPQLAHEALGQLLPSLSLGRIQKKTVDGSVEGSVDGSVDGILCRLSFRTVLCPGRVWPEFCGAPSTDSIRCTRVHDFRPLRPTETPPSDRRGRAGAEE